MYLGKRISKFDNDEQRGDITELLSYRLQNQNLQEFGATVEDCPDDVVRVMPPPVLRGEDFDLHRSCEPRLFQTLTKPPVVDYAVTRDASIAADIFSITQPVGDVKMQKPGPGTGAAQPPSPDATRRRSCRAQAQRHHQCSASQED